MNTVAALSTREKIALAVSGAIVLVSVVYWVMQIGDVIEALKLAYGG
jgi:type II secretory pathway component PulM